MRMVVTALLFFVALNLIAQPDTTSMVLTKEQNDQWFIVLKKSVHKNKLELIKTRILLDTNVYVPRIFPDRIKMREYIRTKNKAISYGRPLLIFNDIFYPNINSGTKSKSVVELANLITEENIKNVTVVKDTKTTALYGSMADCGVILLTTKNRKIFRKIKKIDFGSN